MENEYTKIDDSTMEVVKPAPVVEPTIVTYNIDQLKAQELSILQSKNDYVEERNKELEEVRSLIAEAERLGLKTKEEMEKERESEEVPPAKVSKSKKR